MSDACSVNHELGGKRSAVGGSSRGGEPIGARQTDRAVAELADRQHGVVARRQLIELGLGKRAVENRLERSLLHPIHQGVYAVGRPSLQPHGRWIAAVLFGGQGAVLSHRSAAQLWQLIGRWSGATEITRASGWRGGEGLLVHRGSLRRDEMAAVDGIPVTSVSRTLLDLAAVLNRHQLERALNEAEVRGLTDVVSLPELLERYPRRRGTAALRAILREEGRARGVTRGELEERFLVLVERHRLPRPRLNAPVAVGGRFFELDAAWLDRRLAVELDGRAAHRTRLAFERDRERDRLLLAEGWRVVRVTWRQLRDDGPVLAADLRKIFSARS